MSNKREYAIDDTIQMGLLTLVCMDATGYNCLDCILTDLCGLSPIGCDDIVGECDGKYRVDNKDVIFKLKTE